MKKTGEYNVKQTDDKGVFFEKFVAVEYPIECNSIDQKHDKMGGNVRAWQFVKKRSYNTDGGAVEPKWVVVAK